MGSLACCSGSWPCMDKRCSMSCLICTTRRASWGGLDFKWVHATTNVLLVHVERNRIYLEKTNTNTNTKKPLHEASVFQCLVQQNSLLSTTTTTTTTTTATTTATTTVTYCDTNLTPLFVVDWIKVIHRRTFDTSEFISFPKNTRTVTGKWFLMLFVGFFHFLFPNPKTRRVQFRLVHTVVPKLCHQWLKEILVMVQFFQRHNVRWKTQYLFQQTIFAIGIELQASGWRQNKTTVLGWRRQSPCQHVELQHTDGGRWGCGCVVVLFGFGGGGEEGSRQQWWQWWGGSGGLGRKPTQIVNGVDCRKCIDGVGGWQSNGQVGGVEQRCQGKTSVCFVRHTTVQNRGYSTEQSDACDRMSDAVHDRQFSREC